MRGWATTTLATLTVAATGCGAGRATSPQPGGSVSSFGTPNGPRAHPQAINPIAGEVAPSVDPAAAAGVSVDPSGGGASSRLAQPVSDAEIRRELAQSGLSASAGQATLTPDGLAIPPADAPALVQRIIEAGNQIARLPYRFGGGHGTFVDTAYDCSGSVSFALAAAGILNTTLTSGEFETWGVPGRGKWITIFANAGHMFMYVAGLRFDTVARAQTGSRWSNRAATERDGFAVRHLPGL